MGSRWFRRPAYESGPPRGPLNLRLKGFISSHASAQQSSQSLLDFAKLSTQIDAFHSSFLQLEASTPTEVISAIKYVVKEAFPITVDGVSLSNRLESLGFPTSVIDTREVREVNKLANYWRICRSLADTCRSYRALFSRLQLETLEHYEPSSTPGTKQKRYVHAEVQILVCYETSSFSHWPRAIGASKEACFLCDAFIKAHGSFHVSKAHRQVFSQWTVPDRRDYSTATLKRFRRALVVVDQSVMEELKRVRNRQDFRPFPLQSSINLHKPMLPTPSVSTVRSLEREAVSTTSPIGSSMESRSSTPRPVAKPDNDGLPVLDEVKATSVAGLPFRTSKDPLPVILLKCATDEPTADAAAADTITAPSHSSRNHSTCPSQAEIRKLPYMKDIDPIVTPQTPKHMSVDWLSLHIYLEDDPPTCETKQTATPGDYESCGIRTFSRATVSLEPVQVCEAAEGEYFNIGDLAPGEEKVIEKSGNEGECELRFTVVNEFRGAVEVCCKWFA